MARYAVTVAGDDTIRERRGGGGMKDSKGSEEEDDEQKMEHMCRVCMFGKRVE